MSFEYQIEKKDQYILVNLSGVLIGSDQSTDLADEVQGLIDQGTQNVIVSLAGIETMNSTGLSVMISILTKTRNAGGEVVITDVPQKVNELMVITKLNTVFTVAESVEEAIELLKKEESWL